MRTFLMSAAIIAITAVAANGQAFAAEQDGNVNVTSNTSAHAKKPAVLAKIENKTDRVGRKIGAKTKKVGNKIGSKLHKVDDKVSQKLGRKEQASSEPRP